MSLITDQVMSKLKPEEQEAVRMILKEYSNTGKSDLLTKLYDVDFLEIPVDIDTFIESPEYAGWFTENGNKIFPYWREKLRQVFAENSPYSEIVFGGSIGCGKSTIAVIGLAYTLYWLMCLKDPNPYFKLGRGDTIYLVFFNATLQLSRGVAYSKFQDLLQHSPWFKARGTITGTKYLEYTPNKTENSHIEFTVGSRPEHSLGKAIIAGIMDEINFVKGQDEDLTKSKIMDTYANVLARIKSRFIVNGKVRGRVFLVSSKHTESDFIEAYIRKVKGNPGVFIADARLYELKATEFCGEKFRVAVGGSNLPSKIIPDDEQDETYIAQGYLVEEVPIELKQDFQLDIMRALRDHCGIAMSNVTRLIAYSSIEQCLIPQKNPFKSNVLTIGMLDSLKYQDFFEPELVPPEIYTKPMFVHLDCSLTGDKTGIGCVAVLGYTNREGFDYITGEHREIKELVYREVFDIGIQCPNGSEISFRKNREFIYYLKYGLGWNIKGISLDGFQSADSKQQFITMGFTDTTIVSLDRKPDGYLALKSAFIEKRIQFLSGQNELTTELVNLKQDNETGKVDHDVEHCFTADTKIQLVDGRVLSIADLLIEQQYKDNYVYTFNEITKVIEPKKIRKVFQTKLTSDLIRVTLDNGESVECTPWHKFMLRDGTYCQAEKLVEGVALMPLYTKYPSGNLSKYRMYYEPIEEKWHFEHRRFCSSVVHKKDYVVHHCNFNKSDNRPTNLKCMSKSEHNTLHNNQTKDYSIVSEKVAAWHKRSKDDPNYIAMHKKGGETAHNKFYEKNKERLDAKKKERDQYISELESTFNVVYDELSSKEKVWYGAKLFNLKNPNYRKEHCSYSEETHKNLHEIHHSKTWITNGVDNKYVNKTDVIPDGWHLGRTYSEETKHNMSVAQKRNSKLHSEITKKSSTGRVWVNNGSKNKFVTKEQLATLDSNTWMIGRLTPWQTKEYKNHKVVKIERIHKPCRVYDLEIEDNHNFALAIGVFVHNSKDQSDGLAGALYNASLHDGQFAFELVDNAMLFGEVNEPVDDEKINIVNGLLSSPANAVVNRYGNKNSNVNNPEAESRIQEAADMYNGFLSW